MSFNSVVEIWQRHPVPKSVSLEFLPDTMRMHRRTRAAQCEPASRRCESFVHPTAFNCPETEAARRRRSLLGISPWERELDSAKLPELRFLGLGILRELYRVSSRRTSLFDSANTVRRCRSFRIPEQHERVRGPHCRGEEENWRRLFPRLRRKSPCLSVRAPSYSEEEDSSRGEN